MRKYIKPTIEKIAIEGCSLLANSSDIRPGNGWGDKNHDHEHWKDEDN